MPDAKSTYLRKIRSFVRREGRLTSGQEKALKIQWVRYGIDCGEEYLNLSSPLCLEIGFGMGEALIQQARENPDINYLGIEVHRPGVGRLLAEADKLGLTNIQVISDDAVEILKNNMPDNSLNRVNIFFPDPWHKRRHHKRRLIQTSLLDLLAKKFVPRGLLHIATDWQDYAEHIDLTLNQHPSFKLSTKKLTRPKTKFERRGESLGHEIWDFVYECPHVANTQAMKYRRPHTSSI